MHRSALFFRYFCVLALLAPTALTGCGDSASGDAGPDATADGSLDGGVDLGHEGGTDAGRDLGVDMGLPTCTTGCNIVDIASGFRHTCAVRENGTVLCWGRNFWGELGDGSTFHSGMCLLEGGMTVDCSPRPVTVVGVSNAQSIVSHSGPSTCTINMDGTVSCWGWAFAVGTGMSEPAIRNPAVNDTMMTGAVSVGTAFVHACQVKADHTVACMGANGDAELGTGDRTDTRMMVTVAGVTNASTVATSSHTCALLADGTIQCWGLNDGGQLGDGMTHSICMDGTSMLDCSLTAVTVAGIDDALQVDVGDGYTCAIRADHTVWCWGGNQLGQLGQGDTVDQPMPTQVPGLANVAQISTGSDTACAVLMDGTVKCWGYNHHGTVGDGVTGHMLCTAGEGMYDCAPTPVDVVEMGASGLTPIHDGVKVSSGSSHVCLLRASHDVYCWGSNTDHQTAQSVGPPPGIDDIAVPSRVTIPM